MRGVAQVLNLGDSRCKLTARENAVYSCNELRCFCYIYLGFAYNADKRPADLTDKVQCRA